ncbi:YybH family protein [Bradyrhizobium sp. UFLA05-112]
MSKKHEAEEAAIRELDAQWSKAATAKNMDDVMKFYAIDGSIVWPDQPPAKGHADIRDRWEEIFKAAPNMYLDFKPTHIEIASGCDMASDFGVVHFAPHAKPDDRKNTAKYLVVWKREHGNWKVLYDCWNWNAPEKDRK